MPQQLQIFGVQNKSNSNDPVEQAKITLKFKPAQIAIVSHWCDHLEGPKTAKLQLQLTKADGTVKETMDLFGGFHQRGEDDAYIHWADYQGEGVVTQAEAGDVLRVLSICGVNGQFEETEDNETLTLDYEGETRIFFMNMQINQSVDESTNVSADDIVKVCSTKEQTDFERMWPVLRDNLMHNGRIKKGESVPDKLEALWLSQKAEKIPGLELQ